MSNNESHETQRSLRRRLGLFAAVVGAIAVVAFGLAPLAEAGSGWFGGHGFGPHGPGGHGFDAERAHDHAEFATAWALRHLDATDEQQARVQEIVSGVVDQLGAMREAHAASHEAFVDLLSQESIDRERLEQMRVEQMAMAETASSVLASALADVAETLTLEQRTELIEHLESHRPGHGWRHE